MAFSSSISLSPPPVILTSFKPKPCHFLKTHNLFLPFTPPIYLSNTPPSSGKSAYFYHPAHKIPPKRNKSWRNSATSGEVSPSESIPLDNSQEILTSTGGDGSSAIVSVLFFVAFLALSILTTGVIYIGVTDFLRKRERDKFEKEEAAKKKKKKGGKKVRARASAGPRGFGQKSDDYEEDD